MGSTTIHTRNRFLPYMTETRRKRHSVRKSDLVIKHTDAKTALSEIKYNFDPCEPSNLKQVI